MATVQMVNLCVKQRQGGAIMVEVLVALFFVVVVFMGHIGSQTFMQNSSIEASRRAQAQILLNDIVERMQANRGAVQCYAFTINNYPFVGVGGSVPPACGGFGTPETQLRATADLQAWHQLLLNGGVTNQLGQGVGGLKNGKGCISIDETTIPATYTISIAWEGSSLQSMPANVNEMCAKWYYWGGENMRRVISTRVQFGILTS